MAEFLCLSAPVRPDVITLKGARMRVADHDGEGREEECGVEKVEGCDRWSTEIVMNWLQADGQLASAVRVYEPGEVLFER
jgi:hypothetical protein